MNNKITAEENLLHHTNQHQHTLHLLKQAIWEARQASVPWNRIAELAQISRTTAQNYYTEINQGHQQPERIILDTNRIPPELLQQLKPYIDK